MEAPVSGDLRAEHREVGVTVATLVQFDAVGAVVSGKRVADDDGQIARAALVHTQPVAIQRREAVAVEFRVKHRDVERRSRPVRSRRDRVGLCFRVAGLVRERLVVEQHAVPASLQLGVSTQHVNAVQRNVLRARRARRHLVLEPFAGRVRDRQPDHGQVARCLGAERIRGSREIRAVEDGAVADDRQRLRPVVQHRALQLDRVEVPREDDGADRRVVVRQLDRGTKRARPGVARAGHVGASGFRDR